MNKRNLILISLAALILFVLVGRPYLASKKSGEAHSYITFSLDELKNKKNLIDIAIIGSGPAGWSAALYGARLGNYTVVISGNFQGGQLIKTSYIENWPGFEGIKGGEVMYSVPLAQAKTHGAEASSRIPLFPLISHLAAVLLKTEEGRTLYAASLIVMATGSSPLRHVNIPGRKKFLG